MRWPANQQDERAQGNGIPPLTQEVPWELSGLSQEMKFRGDPRLLQIH
jgi:hypothetical protein